LIPQSVQPINSIEVPKEIATEIPVEIATEIPIEIATEIKEVFTEIEEIATEIKEIATEIPIAIPVNPLQHQISTYKTNNIIFKKDQFQNRKINGQFGNFYKNYIDELTMESGGYHSCYLTPDIKQQLKCWGMNINRQTDAPKVYKPLSFSLGFKHTCAVDINNQLMCWGMN